MTTVLDDLPIIDNFDRATDTTPPPGANWATIYNGHDISANRLQGHTSSDANVSAYIGATYGPNAGFYIQMINTASAFYWGLYFLDSTYDHGYMVAIEGGNVVKIYKVDTAGADETVLGADISQSFADGDWLGMSFESGTIKAYRKPSGGSWAELGSRSDSTYSDMDSFSIFCYSTIPGDNFGGGTVSGGAEAISPSVSDGITLGESQTVTVSDPQIGVSDNLTVGESSDVDVISDEPGGTLSIAVTPDNPAYQVRGVKVYP